MEGRWKGDDPEMEKEDEVYGTFIGYMQFF